MPSLVKIVTINYYNMVLFLILSIKKPDIQDAAVFINLLESWGEVQARFVP